MLSPALNRSGTRLWPFEGSLDALMTAGTTVIAETYPAECYGWFDDMPVSKQNAESRIRFGKILLQWAQAHAVRVESKLEAALRNGFELGKDDAFDAVVGLFGMLQICLGLRTTGEPTDDVVRRVEGWILGRRVGNDCADRFGEAR